MAKEAIVIVDPISTGGSVAFEAYTRGFAVIACWCNELTPEFKSHLPDCCLTDFSFYAEVEEGEKTIAETAAALVFGNVTNGTDVVTAIEAAGAQF